MLVSQNRRSIVTYLESDRELILDWKQKTSQNGNVTIVESTILILRCERSNSSYLFSFLRRPLENCPEALVGFVLAMSHPTPFHSDPDPDCTFCTIISAFPPTLPPAFIPPPSSSSSCQSNIPCPADPIDSERTFPPTYVIFSSPDVIAFLDIAPLTRGHVLVAPRKHVMKLGDLGSREGAEVYLFSLSSPCL